VAGSAQMKILMLDVVKPQLNGAGAVHRWELIRNLVKIGHDVYVIAYNNIEFKGVHTNLLQTKKCAFNKWLSRFRYVGLLFKLAMEHHFDILYTRNGLTGVLGYIIKVMTGSKFVYELNGIASDEYEMMKKQNKGNIFEKIVMALSIQAEVFALKKADAIIAVTLGIKNYLVNRGINESKIAVIENGVNIDMFKPMDDPTILQRLRKQYSTDGGVIIFVGNLAPWQGVESLIKAAHRILEKVPKTRFLIVGDGVMRNELEDAVKDFKLENKFIFTGSILYEDVPKYINISDVCVAPFMLKRNEKIGLSPLKIYEYLACAKPIVVSNIKGVGNLLEDSNSGISVPPDSPNELAKAIIKLLNDKHLREQMGKNGREIVVNNYSWENTAKKTIEVFESILD
jgi:glycosyltransferase involved in cell wall biosynthesis